ncbi:MAG: glycosyltransferase family 4 protein [Calditrichaceae bacterium]|nr:glycosyltransferase family 4 protein [Calditrichaceae bacterium]MBN2710265.1 glycosyltransferase family 4 protein [Calditrichaceae bacterium]RQV93886.1 MAG: glycosyltransferase [Calditrichota bacterium]
MRIGFVRDTYFTNEPRGLNIARKLVKERFEVFVLCYGDHDTIENHHGIVIHRKYLNKKFKKVFRPLINTFPIYSWIWIKKIKEFIITYNIEVLQVHDLYMLGSAIKANREYRLPIVANFHENYPAAVLTYNWANSVKGRALFRPKIWKKLQGEYLRNVDKIIVTCQEYKENLLKLYNYLSSENIFVYLNVPDLDEFNNYKISKDVFDKGDNFILFYFGVNAERRGLFIMLDALKLLVKKHSNIKLLLIGPVDIADIERFNIYLNNPVLKDHIIFYDWKDISEIPSYIVKSDICLSPLLENEHHNTTIANKLFQYMLFEKPMVISDCKPQARLIKETEAGALHKANKAESLAEKVLELYDDPIRRLSMGKAGKFFVKKKYNTEVESKKIIEMYRNIEKNFKG